MNFHLNLPMVLSMLSGFAVWGITELVGAYRKYRRGKHLTAAHIPEIDAEAAGAGERAANNWKTLFESEQAKLAQIQADHRDLVTKFAHVVKRLERVELDKSTMDRMYLMQRDEIALLEDIVGTIIPFLPKADTKTRELVEAKRAALKSLRAESHEYLSKRQEFIQFLTTDIPAMAAAGSALERYGSSDDGGAVPSSTQTGEKLDHQCFCESVIAPKHPDIP